MNHLNRLELARKRSGYSQKRVAALLRVDPSMISHLERGSVLPRLPTALCLEALYRTPVAYLYPELYHDLRNQLRKGESHLMGASAHRKPRDYTRART